MGRHSPRALLFNLVALVLAGGDDASTLLPQSPAGESSTYWSLGFPGHTCFLSQASIVDSAVYAQERQLANGWFGIAGQ